MSLFCDFKIFFGEFSLSVNDQIPLNGITALFGPSGCGKTTFLRIVAGLEQHQNCNISFNDIIWQSEKKMLPPHKRPIGYVFQDGNLFSHLTVDENITFGIKRRGESPFLTVKSVIENLSLEKLLSQKSGSLSGGERQRVAIARALVCSPQLILMDEPLSALDKKSKQSILPFIEYIRDELKIPILYVSHSPEEISRLADNIVLMERGGVKAIGETSEILTREDLPFTSQDDCWNTLNGVAHGYDEKYSLLEISVDSLRLFVIGKSIKANKKIRLQVHAKDVSLTRDKSKNSSILNILPVTVHSIVNESGGKITLKLRLENQFILSNITQKSFDRMAISVGELMYAQIKAVSLL